MTHIDRYEIVRSIGQGRLGAVYEAHDPELARAVALKLLDEAGGDPPEARRRAEASVAAAEALGHPGILADALLDYAFQFNGQDPRAAQAARERALTLAGEAGDANQQLLVTLRLLDAASVAVDLAAIEALLPVARAAMARPGVPDSLRHEFYDDEATALIRLARFDDGRAACERLAAVDPPPQVKATQCRCVLSLAESDYDGSETHCKAALTAAEQALGPSHPATTARISNYAQAKRHRGQVDEAVALDARAVAIEEAAYGPESAEVANLLCIQGNGLVDLGKLAEAQAALERCLAIRKRLDGDGPPGLDQAHAEADLAEILVQTGQLEAGLARIDHALAIFEQTAPDTDPQLVRMYAMHGSVNSQAERWLVVERSMKRCIELATKIHGKIHPLRAVCMLELAQMQIADHRAAEAVPHAREALEILAGMGASPINLGAIHGVLGRALGESGDRRGAREHTDRAIELFESLGERGKPNLAEARRQRKRW